MSSDLNIHLGHVVPDTKCHRFYMRAQTDGDLPAHTGERIAVETTIRDGRNLDLKLDKTSFELFQHPTQLSTEDFYADSGKIISIYYEEMKALFTKVTGSPHVKIFHHQVRNQSRVSSDRVMKDGGVTTNTPVQPYAVDAIHTDSSSFHSEEMFKQFAPEDCRRGRFLYLNAWRSISDEPIQDYHLAVLDEQSVVKPDDYVPTHLHGVGYDVLQYRLSSRNAASHKWYYFPRMIKDEVLVFKQWDSDPCLSGRSCFHTAFKDPTAREGASARQSIETRAFVFFPDHEPNTCPLFPVVTDVANGETDTARAERGSVAVVGAIAYIHGSPSIRLMVVTHMTAMYASGGARAVLAEFVEDKQGHFGMTDASAATKQLCVELCMKKGLSKEVDSLFKGPSAAGIALAMVVESRMGAAVFGAAAAVTMMAVWNKCTKQI